LPRLRPGAASSSATDLAGASESETVRPAIAGRVIAAATSNMLGSVQMLDVSFRWTDTPQKKALSGRLPERENKP